jgi:hypothetical protein
MRNKITNARKLRRISRETGKTVVSAMTRGNTDHRIDFADEDGGRWSYWRHPFRLERENPNGHDDSYAWHEEATEAAEKAAAILRSEVDGFKWCKAHSWGGRPTFTARVGAMAVRIQAPEEMIGEDILPEIIAEEVIEEINERQTEADE